MYVFLKGGGNMLSLKVLLWKAHLTDEEIDKAKEKVKRLIDAAADKTEPEKKFKISIDSLLRAAKIHGMSGKLAILKNVMALVSGTCWVFEKWDEVANVAVFKKNK